MSGYPANHSTILPFDENEKKKKIQTKKSISKNANNVTTAGQTFQFSPNSLPFGDPKCLPFKFNAQQSGNPFSQIQNSPTPFGQTNTTAKTNIFGNKFNWQQPENPFGQTQKSLTPFGKTNTITANTNIFGNTGGFGDKKVTQNFTIGNTNLVSSSQQSDSLKKTSTKLSVKLKDIESALTNALGKIETMEKDMKNMNTYISLLKKRISGQNDKALLSRIDEIEDRMRRESNVILFGLPEADKSLSFKEKCKSDRDKTIAILNILLPNDVPSVQTLQRFGETSEMAPQSRAMRVTFVNKESVRKIIEAFKTLKLQEEPLPECIPDSLSISWDKTRLQLKEFKKVRLELQKRLSEGEEGIRISYKNGSPVIVSQRLLIEE